MTNHPSAARRPGLSRQRIIGLAVVVIGALFLLVFIPAGVDSPRDVPHITWSPSFWPSIVSVLLMSMGMALIVRPDKPPPQTPADDRARPARLLVTLGMLFAFYFAVDTLGLVAPAMLLMFGLMRFAGEKRDALIATIAITVPVGLYFFFEKAAGVPIPLGVFDFLKG